MSQNIDPKILDSFFDSFESLTSLGWMEKNLSLPDTDGKFLINDCGRDFLKEPLKYMTFEALTPNGKPVVVLKGRQVGMSVTAEAIYLYLLTSGNYSSLKVFHAFPFVEQTTKIHDQKIMPMIERSVNIHKKAFTSDTEHLVGKKIEKGARRLGEWNKTIKDFRSGNQLFVDAVSRDASRMRGLSFDVIVFDELQDMTQKAVDNVAETLSATKYGPTRQGVQMYFGTPLLGGSYFEKVWNLSDQRNYHLKCNSCEDIFPLYIYGDREYWKKIWIKEEIIECPLCLTRQSKTDLIKNGEWIPLNDHGMFRGYFLNQLYMPGVTKEYILNKEKRMAPMQFANEVLGEFYNDYASRITPIEIIETCAKDDLTYQDFIIPEQHKTITQGVDWGGKIGVEMSGGQSWTYSVVLNYDERADQFIVEHINKILDKDPDEQLNRIVSIGDKFSCRYTVCDFGYGHDKIPRLNLKIPNKVMGCYSTTTKRPFNFSDKTDPQFISVNKDYIISELLSMIRQGKISMPYKNIDDRYKTEDLITQICSMREKDRISGGSLLKHYVKGDGPNDAFMALMYAYIAYRFFTTNKFANTNIMGSFKSGRNMAFGKAVDHVAALKRFRGDG